MSLESYLLFIPQTSIMNNSKSTLLFFCVLVFIFSLFLSPGGLAWSLSKLHKPHRLTAIPGPTGIPFLGLLFSFTAGSLTHRVLANLSNSFKAKPLMAFSVGLTRFVVSSQPETAKEILNSSAFADRPVKETARELLFHRAMGFAPHGDYWRSLRRISATHLFSPKRIAFFGSFRVRIGLEMVEKIRVSMERDGEVGVRRVLDFGSLKNVMTCVFGESGNDNEFLLGFGGHEVEELVREGYDLLGIFNWSDHFPLLGFLDLQGIRKRCKKLVVRVNDFVGKIIDEHRLKNRVDNNITNDDDDGGGDFVDVLLGLEKENRLISTDMIAVLWEMIFRGTDTVAILLEWTLARMILHQDIQSKAQSEINAVLGGSHRLVSDSDLPKLRYVRAIVKETLRLHPPGPLLSWARLATRDSQIGQHMVPAGTTAVVNMWAITHDDQVWPEPDHFSPDRFMKDGEDFALTGTDLRLAPFGSGRRVCPGKAMGLATVELWLAQFLQSFNWVPIDDDGKHGRGVDLSETLKLSLEMKHSLVCKVIPRASSSNMY